MIKKRYPCIASIVSLSLLIVVASLAPGSAPATAVAATAPSGPLAAAQVAEYADLLQQAGDPVDDTTRATIDLSAGFIMDPYLLPVIGAGDVAAGDLVEGCNGFVDTDPDVVVNWSGETPQLSFFVYSDGDAALVVEQPDGSILCNDDAGLNTVDPLVVIENPAEGAYRIRIGAARQGEPALGFLAATSMVMDDVMLADLDLRPMLTRRERPRVQPLPRLDPSTLLTSRPGIFGAATLEPGFEPIQRFAAGGGAVPAFSFEDEQLACAGFVSLVPSYSFTWSGDAEALRVFFEAREDSALAVVTPDNQLLCNRSASEDNLNPALDIPAPDLGRYKVYIASMEPDNVVTGRLTITGDVDAVPATLAPAAE